MHNRIVEKPVKGLHFKPLCYVIRDTAVGKYVACEEPARYNEKKSYNVSRSIDTAEGFTTSASAKKWIEAYANGKDDVDTTRFIVKPIYPEAFKESIAEELDAFIGDEKDMIKKAIKGSKILDVDGMDNDITHKVARAIGKASPEAKKDLDAIDDLKKEVVKQKAGEKGIEVDMDMSNGSDLEDVAEILDNVDDMEGTAMTKESRVRKGRLTERSIYDLERYTMGVVYFLDKDNKRLFITYDEDTRKLGLSESFIDAELFEFNRNEKGFNHDYVSERDILDALTYENPDGFISEDVLKSFTYGALANGDLDVSDPDYYNVDLGTLADEYIMDLLHAVSIAPKFNPEDVDNDSFSVGDAYRRKKRMGLYA